MSKMTGGVADYFATLGVGDQLIWKHTQKQNSIVDESQATNISTSSDQDVLVEDEAALMERFYREIVHVAIFASPVETSSTDDASLTASQVSVHPKSSVLVPVDVPSNRYSSATSPSSNSDATTVATNVEASSVVSPSNAAEMEGFQILQQTCPASRAGESDPVTAQSVSTGGYPSVNDSVMSYNSASDADTRNTEVWSKRQVFDANLDPIHGLRGELMTRFSFSAADGDSKRSGKSRQSVESAPLRGLGKKVSVTLRNLVEDRFKDQPHEYKNSVRFHLGYRRRNPGEKDRPAVADLSLRYVRIHRSTLCSSSSTTDPSTLFTAPRIADEASVSSGASHNSERAAILKRGLATAARAAGAGTHKLLEKYREVKERKESGKDVSVITHHQQALFTDVNEDVSSPLQHAAGADAVFLPLEEFLTLPSGFDEWSIPSEYELLRFPHPDDLNTQSISKKTVLVSHGDSLGGLGYDEALPSNNSGVGVEAYVEGNAFGNASFTATTPRRGRGSNLPSIFVSDDDEHEVLDPEVYIPKILPERLPELNDMDLEEDFLYIPVLAIRRQRVEDEERYHEDPGIIEMAVSFSDHSGSAVMPETTVSSEEDDGEEDEGFSIVGKTSWSRTGIVHASTNVMNVRSTVPRFPIQPLGTPLVLVRRNIPLGFADAPFATRVQDRFPLKNYKGLPLPEEELPMFCYPTGCRLYRAQFSDCPLAEYYGFVVKNERGDSIHVSCVSFMEPLTPSKNAQLNKMSERRRRTSIPHRRFCERRARKKSTTRHAPSTPTGSSVSELRTHEEAGMIGDGLNGAKATSDTVSTEDAETSSNGSFNLVAFDDMTTFENKTICLVSRYPFWTAFRRFLSHLHILSGSSSDLPLERWISHLLLTVPVPKPGGPSILVPLPTLSGSTGGPMVLQLPPAKDLPLVDLPFHRLVACLDVPTIVTVVLGFLAMERKVIIMSSRPSLVLDGCELLRSLLFPFDLCAPYVPRLTQPFMSCLDFPGAIFVGIHDDGTDDGLAAIVRRDLPEDSTIVDLDTGEIDCSGDRYEVLKQCWGVIPAGPRSQLVSEIETLCRDAGIVPGQEPLDSQIDPAFDAALPSHVVDDFGVGGDRGNDPLDDRGVRDAFLRFFCSVLAGYERFLVVPDVDFLISGNEWFDTKGFLAAAPHDRAPFLGSLVTTQLFQSFIQRRTEASDVHCLLFDESLAEYHSSPIPYGRLGGDVETTFASEAGQPRMLYSLLVDQCSTEPYQHDESSRLEDAEQRSNSDNVAPILKNESFASNGNDDFVVNMYGDIVTVPSKKGLVLGSRFSYYVDGNPCFPQVLSSSLFLPSEPESLLVEVSEAPEPLLSRSEREVDEANRRRKIATSYRGLNNQRRCMWQLPKLMGSHFLGCWLMCIPSQVGQSNLSQDQQARYLLRALGALRILRNRQRVIPDEAAYRALMVACGRTRSDRRTELVKLFGLLRSDGIFPSAVTLGQYTRAIAEGFSKRSTGKPSDDTHTEIGSFFSGKDFGDVENVLHSLDGTLEVLEDSGRRWRQRETLSSEKPKKRSHQKSWVPVSFASSFVPSGKPSDVGKSFANASDMELIALWSRTCKCESCSYIPLDEELQSGWDVAGGGLDVPGAVSCPRCGSSIVARIGYKEFTLEHAMVLGENEIVPERSSRGQSRAKRDFDGDPHLPPQIGPVVDAGTGDGDTPAAQFVTYLNPSAMRTALERHVNERGEAVLQRETLRKLDPVLFINFLWYCARFSLPLPLPIQLRQTSAHTERPKHVCAFAAWDRSVAERGCYAAARTLASVLAVPTSDRQDDERMPNMELFDNFPLLASFNLQGLSQGDWDHPHLSKILVTLVEACEKRDFKPVVECVLRCNRERRENMLRHHQNISGEGLSLPLSAYEELDCYRTLVYLAKYQCTTAFHAFFPAVAKPCKGYHFWCPTAPSPIFDRLYRDAMKGIQSNNDNSFTPLHDVSDVALGFRCVFGHLI